MTAKMGTQKNAIRILSLRPFPIFTEACGMVAFSRTVSPYQSAHVARRAEKRNGIHTAESRMAWRLRWDQPRNLQPVRCWNRGAWRWGFCPAVWVNGRTMWWLVVVGLVAAADIMGVRRRFFGSNFPRIIPIAPLLRFVRAGQFASCNRSARKEPARAAGTFLLQ